MTREEIERLERIALEQAIDQHLMGYKRSSERVPYYTLGLGNIRRVVKTMRGRGYDFLFQHNVEEPAMAAFRHSSHRGLGMWYTMYHDEPGVAICRAALLAVTDGEN